MAKYLVTGGAGFIGSHLVRAILNNGDSVRVLDNFSTGRRSNLTPFLSDIELIEGDLRTYHLVQKAVAGTDFILHQAALPSVPRSVYDPITSNDVNVNGTLNVLYAAKESGVKRVVYASSSSVYGDNPAPSKNENLVPNPKSPYAVSKLTAEYYCKVFFQVYGLETVALRYFNVFGPNQDPNSPYSAVIPKFLTLMLKGESPIINGDGTITRDFTYVANNVRANLLACTAPEAAGKAFNIACGESHSLNDLMNGLNQCLKTNIAPVYGPKRAADVEHSKADISLAAQFLGYKPELFFQEGLQLTVDSFLI